MSDTSHAAPPAAIDRSLRAEKTGEGSGSILSEVKEAGAELVDAVREKTDSLLTDQKNYAADQIHAAASLLRNSVNALGPQDRGVVADYAEIAADSIGQFADKVRHSSWRALVADAEDLARQWPIAFMASALGVGFVAGRFLLASGARSAMPVPGTDRPAPPASTPGSDGHETGSGNVTVLSDAPKSGYGAGVE